MFESLKEALWTFGVFLWVAFCLLPAILVSGDPFERSEEEEP